MESTQSEGSLSCLPGCGESLGKKLVEGRPVRKPFLKLDRQSGELLVTLRFHLGLKVLNRLGCGLDPLDLPLAPCSEDLLEQCLFIASLDKGDSLHSVSGRLSLGCIYNCLVTHFSLFL